MKISVYNKENTWGYFGGMEYKKKFTELTIEELQVKYFEGSPVTKNRVMTEIYRRFNGFIIKESYKKSNFLCSYDQEDWKAIIMEGMWKGFEQQNAYPIVANIVYYAKDALTREIQTLIAKKRGYFSETAIDFIENLDRQTSIELEPSWIANMAIEKALSKLPEKTQQIVNYFLAGYPVLTDRWDQPQTGPCIAKFMNMKDAAIYNHLNRFKTALEKEGYGKGN